MMYELHCTWQIPKTPFRFVRALNGLWSACSSLVKAWSLSWMLYSTFLDTIPANQYLKCTADDGVAGRPPSLSYTKRFRSQLSLVNRSKITIYACCMLLISTPLLANKNLKSVQECSSDRLLAALSYLTWEISPPYSVQWCFNRVAIGRFLRYNYSFRAHSMVQRPTACSVCRWDVCLCMLYCTYLIPSKTQVNFQLCCGSQHLGTHGQSFRVLCGLLSELRSLFRVRHLLCMLFPTLSRLLFLPNDVWKCYRNDYQPADRTLFQLEFREDNRLSLAHMNIKQHWAPYLSSLPKK